MIPDRARFIASRLQRDAHGHNIHKFVRYLNDSGENPTPRDEIAYAVRLTDAIGQRIAKALMSLNLKTRTDRR